MDARRSRDVLASCDLPEVKLRLTTRRLNDGENDHAPSPRQRKSHQALRAYSPNRTFSWCDHLDWRGRGTQKVSRGALWRMGLASIWRLVAANRRSPVLHGFGR